MSNNNDLEFVDKGDVIYCGKKEEVPFGYDRKGESYECFKSGLGVGYASSKDLKRTENSEKINVLSNLELLRLANRLGIRNVNNNEEPFSRTILLEGISNRLDKMENHFKKKNN